MTHWANHHGSVFHGPAVLGGRCMTHQVNHRGSVFHGPALALAVSLGLGLVEHVLLLELD